jgi:hypothetical protein
MGEAVYRCAAQNQASHRLQSKILALIQKNDWER